MHKTTILNKTQEILRMHITSGTAPWQSFLHRHTHLRPTLHTTLVPHSTLHSTLHSSHTPHYSPHYTPHYTRPTLHTTLHTAHSPSVTSSSMVPLTWEKHQGISPVGLGLPAAQQGGGERGRGRGGFTEQSLSVVSAPYMVNCWEQASKLVYHASLRSIYRESASSELR